MSERSAGEHNDASPGAPDPAALNRALHRLGHDVRNRLNALQLNAHCMLQSPMPPGLHDIVESNAAAIRELGALTDLMILSSDLQVGQISPESVPENPGDVLIEVAATLRREHPGREVRSVGETGDPPWIAVDRVLLSWALRAVARSGFESGEGAIILDFEPVGEECHLSVATESSHIPSVVNGEAAWSESGGTRAIELEVARRVVLAQGGTLQPDADAEPPRWVVTFSGSRLCK